MACVAGGEHAGGCRLGAVAGVEGGDVTQILFIIPGDPVSKGRPRFTRRGITFTPAETKNYEAWVKLCASQIMAGREPFSEPIVLSIEFFLAIPGSWPAWKIEAATTGHIQHVSRPDCDNLLKAIKDAGNGIVWRDDSQIVKVEASKLYSHQPRAEVSVVELARISSAKEWAEIKRRRAA
jgi:Holliday junction resolvase RusA-like endonuclease